MRIQGRQVSVSGMIWDVIRDVEGIYWTPQFILFSICPCVSLRKGLVQGAGEDATRCSYVICRSTKVHWFSARLELFMLLMSCEPQPDRSLCVVCSCSFLSECSWLQVSAYWACDWIATIQSGLMRHACCVDCLRGRTWENYAALKVAATYMVCMCFVDVLHASSCGNCDGQSGIRGSVALSGSNTSGEMTPVL